MEANTFAIDNVHIFVCYRVTEFITEAHPKGPQHQLITTPEELGIVFILTAIL
jgi:hypothetical protein